MHCPQGLAPAFKCAAELINSKFTLSHFYIQGIAHSKNKYDSVPVILVGNKTDLDDDRDIRENEGKEVRTNVNNKIRNMTQININGPVGTPFSLYHREFFSIAEMTK